MEHAGFECWSLRAACCARSSIVFFFGYGVVNAAGVVACKAHARVPRSRDHAALVVASYIPSVALRGACLAFGF